MRSQKVAQYVNLGLVAALVSVGVAMLFEVRSWSEEFVTKELFQAESRANRAQWSAMNENIERLSQKLEHLTDRVVDFHTVPPPGR